MKVLAKKYKYVETIINCPNCMEMNSIKGEIQNGKTIRCKKCAEILTINEPKNTKCIFKNEVFDCYEESINYKNHMTMNDMVRIAKQKGYKYVDIYGYVFNVDDVINREMYNINNGECICTKEQLIDKIWFTSDTHFSHFSDRTLKLSRRPFSSLDNMNSTMINNWNNVVKDNHVVYHLGDFGDFDYVKRLNGHVILIKGNHDDMDRDKILEYGFVDVIEDYLDLDEYNLRLTHKPSDLLKENKFGLFGHIHNLQLVKPYGVNVGVDCHNFTPIDLDTVNYYINGINNVFNDDVFK